jgi:hypothetical protein
MLPAPDPGPEFVTVRNELLDVAVHGQPAGVVTFTLPEFAPERKLCVVPIAPGVLIV